MSQVGFDETAVRELPELRLQGGPETVDVAVVGAGLNSLIAAALLARGGARVHVFERRAELGGLASSIELPRGGRAHLGWDDLGLVRVDLLSDLELDRYGLIWEESALLGVLTPASGERLALWRDVGAAREALARSSPADASRWPGFLEELSELAGRLEQLCRGGCDLGYAAALVRDPRLLRALGLSADRLLSEWLEGGAIRTLLGSLACRDVAQGPFAWSSGVRLVWQLIGSTAVGLRGLRRPIGGATRLISALASVVGEHGGVVHTEHAVSEILTERGSGLGPRAVGVRLEDGVEVRARWVLSGLDPHSTLVGLVGPTRLEVRTVRALRALRYRGVRARLFFELDQPAALDLGAQWTLGPWPGGFAPATVAAGPESLERAADDAKYGRWSASPWLEVWPQDDARVLAVNVQCVPYALRQGPWDATARRELVARVGELLSSALPELGALGNGVLLLPGEWEREVGAREGSATQGEQSLEQLFALRGVPDCDGPTTPIARLLLCGSGAPPAGGPTGLPGWLAARHVLARDAAGST